MRRGTLTPPALLLALALAADAAHGQAPLPLANEELLHSARAWEAHERGDLAALALEKLAAARPDSSEALLELGELYLRMADIAAAGRVRELLQRRFKGSAAAKTFEVEYRFATRNRLQLASVQRLLQLERGVQARAELQRLFPTGAPGGMLSIEYYRLLAGTPRGYAPAIAGLRELATRHPDDPRVQLALARLLLRAAATLQEGVRRLQALTLRDDVKLLEVDDALLAAFKDLGPQTPAHVLRAFLSRHPGDPLVSKLLALQSRALEAQRLLLGDAAVPSQLHQELLEELSTLLWSHANSAPSLLIALHATQSPQHSDVMHAAAAWLGRAHRSAANGQVDLAAVQLAAARALRRGELDSLPQIAARAATLQPEQRSELLALATRFAPRSAWLFAAHVRRLLNEQRETEALALLDARSLDARWTAAARDELRAAAFEQRAQRALAAGDRGQAKADLEQAVRYAPANPWNHYRLAGLYAQEGDAQRGARLFSGAPPSAEMHYAQSLYLSGIDALDEAFAAVAAIAPDARSAGMQAQHDRLRVQLARRDARRHYESGNTHLASATLRAVEPLAVNDTELARTIAFAWIDIHEPERAVELIAMRRSAQADDRDLLLVEAEVLNRLDAEEPLAQVLDRLRAGGEPPDEARLSVARLQRALDLRVIRRGMRDGAYAQAQHRLDELLVVQPNDRTLRSLRAELDLALQQPGAARDRYAVLVAEDPEDLDTRLSYVRALTEAGDHAAARAQLRTVQEQVAPDAIELQLDIARRQLALSDSAGTVRTLEAVHALHPERADVLIALGRAELSRRHFARARAWFARAEHSSDSQLAAQARQAGEQLDLRLQSRVESGFEVRDKPGDDGISSYAAMVAPSMWLQALDFERRVRVHADAINVDSGPLSPLFAEAALLGTVQAAGPGANRVAVNQPQDGISLGVRYETDAWSADLGTSGLGLLLPNLIGGLEWTPRWRMLDFTLGLERRAVTSSVLSFAGMRDPISGTRWGGVVETGPYLQAGLYRERYSLSAALRSTNLTGTHVADNRFVGLRTAADWQFYQSPSARAFVGVTLNHWQYQRNLQNYTFGSGGYYSPQNYLSIALPLELQGRWRGWSYQLRARVAHSNSDIERTAFYPIDPQLQAAAAVSPLPPRFSEPFFAASSGSGLSLSAYAAFERQVTPHLVLGGKLDLDRSDFYEPTVLMFYVRHVFGSSTTPLAVPPRPVKPYNR